MRKGTQLSSVSVSHTEVRASGVRVAASVDEQEVGHCYVYLLRNDGRQEPFGFFEDIFVEESARRQGVARTLAMNAIDLAWERDCYKMLACSRFGRDAQHLRAEAYGYAKWGYEFRIDRP
jgi:GNAT superfamily N-acetyltransferase